MSLTVEDDTVSTGRKAQVQVTSRGQQRPLPVKITSQLRASPPNKQRGSAAAQVGTECCEIMKCNLEADVQMDLLFNDKVLFLFGYVLRRVLDLSLNLALQS